MKLLLPALLVSACLLAPHSAHGIVVTFSDKTFSDTNWTLSVAFNSTAPGESGQSAAQVTSNGNPGYYRSTSLLFGHGYLVVSQSSSNSVYNPATQGAITSIDFAYDFLKVFPTGSEGAVYHSMAIFQEGVLYGLNPGEAPNDQTWATHSHTGLVASDFSNILTNPAPGSLQLYGPAHPDFSGTGAPLQFGYLTGNDDPAGPSGSTSGIDNWTVRVHNDSVAVDTGVYPGGGGHLAECPGQALSAAVE